MQTQAEARYNLLKRLLGEKQLIKAIAGISNYNLVRVSQVVKAAQLAGVAAVDIAASVELVREIRKQTEAILFVSSITPMSLLQAAKAGADVLELGNFDALYEEGIYLGADDVLRLVKETIALQQEHLEVMLPLCVTIPGHLSMNNQIALAQSCEQLGVMMLQTEGASRLLSEEPKMATLTMAEKATVTLRNTRELSQACRLPVMTASGMCAENVGKALLEGASAVGLGRAVTQHNTVEAMATALLEVKQAVEKTSLRLLGAALAC